MFLSQFRLIPEGVTLLTLLDLTCNSSPLTLVQAYMLMQQSLQADSLF